MEKDLKISPNNPPANQPGQALPAPVDFFLPGLAAGGEGCPPPERISPLALAYLGDAVYELYVRRYLLTQGRLKVEQLHKQAVALVRAERQSELVAAIEPGLTEEERAILRRGRNAKGSHQPPHTSIGTYRRATGLEALIGYLYLKGAQQRLEQIFTILFQGAG